MMESVRDKKETLVIVLFYPTLGTVTFLSDICLFMEVGFGFFSACSDLSIQIYGLVKDWG